MKKNIILAIISFIVSMFLLELVIRSYTLRRVVRRAFNSITDVKFDDCRTRDSYLHHALKPNCEGLVRSGGDFSYTVYTNSYGLRSPETTLQKPDGIFRILVLGDSFTEGWGVEDNETFSRVMEKKLNLEVINSRRYARDDSDEIKLTPLFSEYNRIEVINAGIGSYSPILEARYLFSRGLDFDPDMVVMMVDSNDLKDEYFYGGWDAHNQMRAELGKEEIQLSSEIAPDIFSIGRRSKLVEFIHSAIRSKIDTSRQVISYYNLSYNDPLLIMARDWEGYSKSFDLLGENAALVASELSSRNIVFVVSISSRGMYISPDGWNSGRTIWRLETDKLYPPYPMWEIEKQFQKHDITYINTYLPQFESPDGLYFPNDGHWTAKAHQIVGESLTVGIVEKYMTDAY